MRLSSELVPGGRFQRYHVVTKIGEGGFGAVYELLHTQSPRRAALKVLLSKTSPEIAKRFQNEARAANSVRHPCIVDILDQGHFEDGSPWLLMEFIEGETLGERIEAVHDGRTPPNHDPIAILYQLADVLRVLHERGVIHRDLKPANIKLMPDPTRPEGELVKLLDFGIAKFISESLLDPRDEGAVQPKTQVGMIMGSPAYMAPEQCVSAANVTTAADVYALGVIAYELLSGRRPIEAKPPEIFILKLTEDAPPLAEPGVPIEVADLVMSMLRREATTRPTMAAVAETLAALGGRGASGAQLRAWRSVSSQALPDPHVRRRNRTLWLVGGGLVTMGAVAAGLLLALDSSPATKTTSDAGHYGPRIADTYGMTKAVRDLTPADVEDLHTEELQPDLVGRTNLSPPHEALSARRPVTTAVPCTPLHPEPSCFHAKSISKDQQVEFAKAAKNVGLRLCAGQSLVLDKPVQGFLTCTKRPSAVTQQTCDRFKHEADALWKANWPIPDRVEIRCPSK